jgi:hypothetical protein
VEYPVPDPQEEHSAERSSKSGFQCLGAEKVVPTIPIEGLRYRNPLSFAICPLWLSLVYGLDFPSCWLLPSHQSPCLASLLPQQLKGQKLQAASWGSQGEKYSKNVNVKVLPHPHIAWVSSTAHKTVPAPTTSRSKRARSKTKARQNSHQWPPAPRLLLLEDYEPSQTGILESLRQKPGQHPPTLETQETSTH